MLDFNRFHYTAQIKDFSIIFIYRFIKNITTNGVIFISTF